jgi:hypothetical protein
MPVEARGKGIYEKASGKKIGQSKSEEMAKKAARVRNAIHFTTWRPTRRGPKRSI